MAFQEKELKNSLKLSTVRDRWESVPSQWIFTYGFSYTTFKGTVQMVSGKKFLSQLRCHTYNSGLPVVKMITVVKMSRLSLETMTADDYRLT